MLMEKNREMKFETVSVIGLGYIGLPTAAMFASRKIRVLGVDVSQHIVDTINKGEIHIVEPDLDMVVHAAVTEGYLRASTTPEAADVFLIAVPTPFKGENHEPDLSYVEAAAKSIAPVLKKGNLVILESTSPVGTTEKLSAWLVEERPDLVFPHKSDSPDVCVAHCPERVLPGRVMHELVENDRVVGGITVACAEAACALYKIFVRGDCFVTSARTAEMAKLTENAFRDVNIAFANELSIICDKLDINVWELIRLANRHPRVNILQPGPGVGGHCIAVDPWFIVSRTPGEAKLIRQAREVNDSKPEWVLEKIRSAIGAYLTENPEKTGEDVSVACYGLAFKPDIDDLRESPALRIVEQLATEHKGPLLAVEPNIHELPTNLSKYDHVTLAALGSAIVNADVHVILVSHREFRTTQIQSLAGILVDVQGLAGSL